MVRACAARDLESAVDLRLRAAPAEHLPMRVGMGATRRGGEEVRAYGRYDRQLFVRSTTARLIAEGAFVQWTAERCRDARGGTEPAEAVLPSDGSDRRAACLGKAAGGSAAAVVKGDRVKLQLWRALALSMMATIIAAAGALAELDTDRTGGYIAAGGGVAVIREDNFVNPGDFTERTGNSGLVDARGGFRFHEHIAAELQIHYLHEFLTRSNFFNTTVWVQDAMSVNGSANIRGYLLTDKVQPYGLFGLGAMWVQDDIRDLSTTAFMLRTGAGIEFWVLRNFGLDVAFSYNIPFGELDDYQYFGATAALIFRF
jgi:opacity protein-like surface antigen